MSENHPDKHSTGGRILLLGALIAAALAAAAAVILLLTGNTDGEVAVSRESLWSEIPEEETEQSEPEPESEENARIGRGETDAGEDDGTDPLDVAIEDGTAGEDYPAVETDFVSLLEEYGDMLGLLMIPALDLEYPVMWMEFDNEYYVEHDMDGNQDSAGCIMLDGWNSPAFTDVSTIVYGHNMKNMTMFGSLKTFLSDGTPAQEEPYVYFYTTDTVKVYRIFSYYITTDADEAYDLAELEYPLAEESGEEDAAGEEGAAEEPSSDEGGADEFSQEETWELWNAWYDEFVEDVTGDSAFTPAQEPDFTRRPRLLTLATCYGAAGGHDRFLVHCVLEAEYRL